MSDSVAARPYSVFISHASTDEWLARQIYDQVSRIGAKAFLSEVDVKGGDDVGARLREAMSEAHECVVLFTPEAAQSKNVWIEIGGAWLYGKRLTFVLNRITVSEVTSDPRFPSYLKVLNFIDLNNEFDSQYLPQLATRAEEFGAVQS